MTQPEAMKLVPQPHDTGPQLSPVMQSAISILEMKSQVATIQAVMREVMHEDEHYGKIPGTDKPTLLKPGAEKLGMVFRLRPEFEIIETWHPDGHLTVRVKCRLYHIPTSQLIGEGDGICSTKEKKYAYRNGQLKCPECGKAAVLKSKKEPEFYCWAKKDGCGMTFPLDDTRIVSQAVGSVPNDCIADCYNTVLKIGDKRAHVAAILTATAASDIFTQDLEDHMEAMAATQGLKEKQEKADATQAAAKAAQQAAQPPQQSGKAPNPTPPLQNAANGPKEAQPPAKGDGKNIYVTQDQIEKMFATTQKFKFTPRDWGQVIMNVTGIKPSSIQTVTRVQYNSVMSQFVKASEGALTWDRETLKFSVPAAPLEPGSDVGEDADIPF